MLDVCNVLQAHLDKLGAIGLPNSVVHCLVRRIIGVDPREKTGVANGIERFSSSIVNNASLQMRAQERVVE
jgi:hypothetical protein